MTEWRLCKKILVIRPDNIGDLIMSAPAIRAIRKFCKESKITLLTSKTAAMAAALIPGIDDIIIADLPWVKKENSIAPGALQHLIAQIRDASFDGCIIFSVYSQNPLPSALLAWMAGIPLRAAYCRENPYHLLNSWLPEKEPYTLILHQVERDLHLVESLGATTEHTAIRLSVPDADRQSMLQKLSDNSLDSHRPFFVFHAGVSEVKRAFPLKSWVKLAKQTINRYKMPVLFTGSAAEKALTDKLMHLAGSGSVSMAGKLSVTEFAALIEAAKLLVSVNTGAVHIAAGVQTPVIVLYAQTNPQHKPWNVASHVFEYSVPCDQQSRNEVIRYVNRKLYAREKAIPDPEEILKVMNRYAVKDPVF